MAFQRKSSNCCSPGSVLCVAEGARLPVGAVHVADASHLGGANPWGVVVLLSGAVAVAVMVPVGPVVMAVGARVPVVAARGRFGC